MDANLLSQINDARAARAPIAVVTALESGSVRLVLPDDLAADPVADELGARFKSGNSGVLSAPCGDTFIQVYMPPPRLVVIGAVHIAQALYPMAQACGFDVTIIDPRTAFATPERFGDVRLIADWPEEALKDVVLDAYTALVAVTHDPKIDDYSLQAALQAECFYVGALGSRKTHGKRLERMSKAGLGAALLERIHAPIGLDIGASTPAEIALAVMAQAIQALRQGPRL